jgi:hypothetical protein
VRISGGSTVSTHGICWGINTLPNLAGNKTSFGIVMQEITLAGLYRGGFFEKASFYGGTCLRIFHSMPRFSEDMDFSLVSRSGSFSLEDSFPSVVREFSALGRHVEITKEEKKIGGTLIRSS